MGDMIKRYFYSTVKYVRKCDGEWLIKYVINSSSVRVSLK